MTTTVKVEAHCDDNTEVIVSVTDYSINTDNANFEDVVMQDGESVDFYVYDNREITIKEIEKEK